MSCTQFHCIKMFILRHAWLNLWDKHMTTGRINQVTIIKWRDNLSLTTQRTTQAEWTVSFAHRVSIRERFSSLTSIGPKAYQCELFLILIIMGFCYRIHRRSHWVIFLVQESELSRRASRSNAKVEFADCDQLILSSHTQWSVCDC
jgi:hypothetical protein